MSDLYTWTVVAVIALVTAALRFLPFLLFGGNRKTPKIVNRMGRVLPYSVMGMLVVYCLKDVGFGSVAEFLPTAIACLIVGMLYVLKRNTLLSIVVGTISYMILVQMVF